jgi:hypothetical protein
MEPAHSFRPCRFQRGLLAVAAASLVSGSIGVAAQTLKTDASASSTTGYYTTNSQALTGQGAITANAIAQETLPLASGNASSTASAISGAGHVSAYASAVANTFISTPYPFNGVGQTSQSYAYSTARLDDSFSIVASGCSTCGNGTVGYMTFGVQTTGAQSGEGNITMLNPASAVGHWYSYGDWAASGSVNTLDPQRAGFNLVQFSKSGSLTIDSNGVRNQVGNDTFGFSYYTVPFLFGGINDLHLQASATAQAHATGDITAGGSSVATDAYLTSDLLQGLNWGGITVLTDSNGNTVSTFTALSSASNFDYSNAFVASVPEPETYAMLLAGLGLLGATVRRKRNNQV